MKKKEFLTEAKRKAIIADKEKAIIESFAKTFNKIKRIDENEISEALEDNTLKIQLYANESGLIGNLGKENMSNQRKAYEALTKNVPVQFVIHYANDKGQFTVDLVNGSLKPVMTSSYGKPSLVDIDLYSKYVKDNANYKSQETIEDAIKIIMNIGQKNAQEFINSNNVSENDHEDRQLSEEVGNGVLGKDYYKYVIERLSPYFGEFSEYFADILYYYNENKELINPKNDKNIDKIGKSFYGFSSFRSIGSIDKDEAMSYDIHIFTDDKNTIIDTVNYLVNYLKDFRVDSIKQIDFMVDNDSTGDLEQEKFIYDNLIPSEELKKYFIKKSYDKNFTTDNNNSFNPYFMDKI